MIQQAISSAPTRAKACIKKRVFTEEVERDFYKILSLASKKDEILGINKQRLSASKIHKTLCEMGHKISLSTVSNKYREYKVSFKEVYIRQEYEAGSRAEYDFHHVKIKIGSEVKVYHQATIILPHSGYVFTKLYKHEKSQQSLIH